MFDRVCVWLGAGLWLVVATMAVAAPMRVDQVVNPQADHHGWVTDHAEVLPADVEQRLETRLESLHLDLGAEVAIATVGDVDAATPRDFITELFNRWGLGSREANNGFLILMVMDQRRIEMETGYGLEGVLTDTWLGRVRTERMVPAFKRNDYAGGLEQGVIAIDEQMRRYPTEVREGTRGEVRHVERGAEPLVEGVSNVQLGVAGGGLGTLGLLGVGGGLYIRRRRRQCPTCKTQMRRLPEDEEDDHLDEGQELEEAIGSRQWTVYVCRTCEHARTFKRNKWFSGFSDCPSCDLRTMSSTRTVISLPTQSSSGLARIEQDCVNCDYHNTFTRVLPKLPKPSSSSSSSSGGGFSSGGGSFGGGSSGGGGGGSSW